MAMFPNGVPIPQPKPARPEQATTPTAASPEEGGDIRSGWQTFLSDPANRAGLLQFGLSMMANSGSGNTITENVGSALGAGMAARGSALQMEAEQTSEGRKEKRAQQMHDATLGLRKAQTQKTLRQPKEKGPSTSGQVTQKDYAKEWIKFVKDARKNEDERTIAELRGEFDEMWSAATTPPGAAPAGATPSAGAQAAAINQMTLDQLKALDVTKMTPDELKAASARYTVLGGK